jgi:hypothetical protein
LGCLGPLAPESVQQRCVRGVAATPGLIGAAERALGLGKGLSDQPIRARAGFGGSDQGIGAGPVIVTRASGPSRSAHQGGGDRNQAERSGPQSTHARNKPRRATEVKPWRVDCLTGLGRPRIQIGWGTGRWYFPRAKAPRR